LNYQAIAKYIVKEARLDWKPIESKVVKLVTSNFTEWVNKQDISLVRFTRFKCSECLKNTPDYEKAARILSKLPSPIGLAHVNTDAESELKSSFNIQLPLVFLIFRRDEYFPYIGERSAEGIISIVIGKCLFF
jgi:hypothetical protein